MGRQIVYIVTIGEYSDYHIAAVFLDKKSAEMYCAIHNDESKCDMYHIEEYGVGDVIKGNIEIYKAVRAFFKKDGTLFIGDTYLSERKDERFGAWNANYPYRLLFYTKKDATDEEIEKIARDKYAEYMAKKNNIC